MPMSVVVVLLALADGEERVVKDFGVEVDLVPSSLNRALTYLGDEHWSKSKPGLGFISTRRNPRDYRSRIVQLSPKGRSLVQTLEGVLG